MQSDLFDKKIREAADNHHPSYDEQAWHRMLNLLDKHLPVEKDRRRGFFIIILLFLLVGGGTVWFITRPSQNTAPVADNKVKTESTNSPEKTVVGSSSAETKTTTAPVIIPEADNRNYSEYKPAPWTAEKSSAQRQRPNNTVVNPDIQSENSVSNKKTETPVSKNDRVTSTVEPIGVSTELNKTNINSTPSSTEPTASINPETASVNNTKPTDATKAEPQVADQKAKTTKKNKSRQPLPLFASLSMGPDVSFAGTSSLGSTRLLAGAGIGYTFKNRLTIRTGFYSGRKVYSASPDEYNPPPQFWTYYPYLEKVDANCKIYEIPIMLSYDFGRSTKHKWFASAGISSAIMKEETYEYYYKHYPNGATYKSQYTIKNENKHLFSILTLSGGYKKNISDRVFVMAEPYMKVSLQGLGYGKVKLNSGGIMITAGVKPFSHSKPR